MSTIMGAIQCHLKDLKLGQPWKNYAAIVFLTEILYVSSNVILDFQLSMSHGGNKSFK
uniref:Transmembrane protein n=1 Tax=Heterorhabditis bacteriophora TaxID=37862 RepID=A0A1I7X825_HETBA